MRLELSACVQTLRTGIGLGLWRRQSVGRWLIAAVTVLAMRQRVRLRKNIAMSVPARRRYDVRVIGSQAGFELQAHPDLRLPSVFTQ